jgi:glutaredoxin
MQRDEAPSRPLTLTILSRAGCHLCEDMAAVVQRVAAERSASVEVRDVDQDAELADRYGEEVPVLLINGRKAFKYRVTARELRRRLAHERGRRWPWQKSTTRPR